MREWGSIGSIGEEMIVCVGEEVQSEGDGGWVRECRHWSNDCVKEGSGAGEAEGEAEVWAWGWEGRGAWSF